MGLAVASLFYPNSQPYSKRACAFGLRSSSKLPISRRGEAKETPFLFRENGHELGQARYLVPKAQGHRYHLWCKLGDKLRGQKGFKIRKKGA